MDEAIIPRVMPCLLLDRGLVKTVKFREPRYLGDPINTVKIFNEKEVDELIILDIAATPKKHGPRFEVIREIASEAFMPVGYGGGIRNLEDAQQMLKIGVEKIVVCTHAVERPEFVEEAAASFGSQSVVVCLNVKRRRLGRGYELCVEGSKRRTGLDPADFAMRMEDLGAGEIVVNSIDRDGTMAGYDLELLQIVSRAVSVPVVACGGAGTVEHLGQAVRDGGASAVAAGSMFVFHGRHRAVLISFPSREELVAEFVGLVDQE